MSVEKIIQQEVRKRLKRRKEMKKNQRLWAVVAVGAFFLGGAISENVFHGAPQTSVTSSHITNISSATANNGGVAVSGDNVSIKTGFDLYELVNEPEIIAPPPLPPLYEDTI